ncbi:MAG: hypothetical protein GWN53_09075, partial [Gammaproteobacteria bacterium]|nr:hypothetical protein [Gammaproteobacteria bacterium]
DQTAGILASQLDVRQYRDTSLIAIRAQSKDPHEAVRIANEVANAYRDNRLSTSKRQTR